MVMGLFALILVAALFVLFLEGLCNDPHRQGQ
jgi:hypothetical protein